jgi:hypothetical protein
VHSNEIKINNKYAYTYTESVSANFQIIRQYCKQNPPALSRNAYVPYQACAEASSNEYTKDVLRTLGMGEMFISQLSPSTIESYANSESITSIITYMKTDEFGNVVNIPEDEALSVTAIGPNIEQMLPPVEGFSGIVADKTQTSSDGYLRMALIISYEGQGIYKFSIDAEWLNSPYHRLKDTLGACAQNIAIENNTRSGWYMFDYAMCITGEYTTHENIKYNLTKFVNTQGNGNWDGSVVICDLANDSYIDRSNYTYYYNQRLHYEFKATIHQWETSTNFNATATYSQMQIAYGVTPAIEISTGGSGVSIGITADIAHKNYILELDNSITHTP